MDFVYYIFGLWLLLLLIGLPFAIRHHRRYLYLQRQKELKGEKGERFISNRLSTLSNDEYLVVDDLLLKDGDNTHQIDHVVVSKYGVFVIETKNIRGKISGSKYDQCWKQETVGTTRFFYNPLFQNDKHCDVVSNVGHIKAAKVFSIVVFVGKCDLEVQGIDDVIRASELIATIRKHNITLLDEEKMRKVFDRLYSKNILSKKMRSRHKERVKEF